MHNQLPISNTLPIDKLSCLFKSTSATYKFYWFLSILELVEEGNVKLAKKDIFAKMISSSWYTVNYFHLSFGKQDLIQQAVEKILKIEQFSIDIKKDRLYQELKNTDNTLINKLLFHFDINVPHWFLTPWFPKNSNETLSVHKRRIYLSSQNFENHCIYSLTSDFIEINPVWLDYLKLNSKILKDFCFWNLSLFLQARNPNVPDIPNKLIQPLIRNPLTKQRKNYWNIVFNELKNIDCIFTGKKLNLEENNYAIDHFVPHAFVSHDLIWNLIPIDKTYNSKKSDKLPIIDIHFEKFYNLQKTGFEIVKKISPNNKHLEEFLTIFPNLVESNLIDFQRYKETIQPLITIAHNNGFSYINDERK